MHANLANVLKTRVKYPACTLPALVCDGLINFHVVVSLLSAISANVLKVHVGRTACVSLPYISKYYGYFVYYVWGQGALAKAKEEQREKFK